jgi:hypothetical protein
VVATGRRAPDLAVRLKYAGVEPLLAVESKPRRALDIALSATPAGQRLFVLPTYTAMMSLREMIAARGGKQAFFAQ